MVRSRSVSFLNQMSLSISTLARPLDSSMWYNILLSLSFRPLRKHTERRCYVQENRKIVTECREICHGVYSLDFMPLRVTVHSIKPLGSDWGARTVASLPVFLISLCHERSATCKYTVIRSLPSITYQSQSSACWAEHNRLHRSGEQ